MKGWIIVFLLAVVAVGAFGYYRGWFTVEEGKIGEDKEKVRELIHK